MHDQNKTQTKSKYKNVLLQNSYITEEITYNINLT